MDSLGKVAQGCALAVMLVGLAVLAAWALGIEGLKSVLPGLATMKANTALCFTLSGAALTLRGRPMLRWACAGAVLALGGLTLVQEFTGSDLGIDQLLFRDASAAAQTVAPGRMSPATAVSFLLIGAALLLLDARRTVARRAAEVLALGGGAMGSIALLGYAYGVEQLYRLPGFTSVALHTAVAFVVLAAGILCARPDGIAMVFASQGVGGQLARRLLPLALLLPAVLGWLVVLGQRGGLVGPAQGMAVFASTMILALAAFIWRNALDLDASDADRARAGQALEVSRARLAGIVESAMDAIISVDAGQRIVLFNAAAERMFGCPAAAAIGSPIDRFIPGRFREAHARHIVDFARTGATSRAMGRLGSLRGLRSDGEEFPIEASISQIGIAGGKLFTVILRDITERLRAERALLENQRDLNRAQVVARTGSWRLDLRRNELLWSEENHRIFGIPLGTPLSYETFLAAVHPDDRDYVQRRWSAALGGALYDIEHRIVVGDTVKWVRERAELEFDHQGVLVGGFGTTQDITERKQAEVALRASEERLRLFIEHAPAALAMFDREMCYLYASRRWRNDYGLGDRELLGVSHYEVFPDIPERWKAAHRRALAGEVVVAEEDRFVCADRSIQWLRWEVRPWHDALGAVAGILIFTEEITAIKRSEEGVRSAALFPEENPNPVMRATGDGTLLYANPAAAPLLEEWHCTTGGQLPGSVRRTLAIALEAGERQELEARCGERYLSFDLVPIAERHYVNFYGRDVTERTRAEDALGASEERLRLAQQVARIGTFEWNIQTGVNRWTPELEAMYGLAPGGFPATQEAWENLVYAEDRAEAVRRVAQAIETGGFEGEWRVVWPDGSVHWLAGRAWVFRDEAGQPQRLIGVNIDITERKAAEAALRDYADRLQTLSRRLIEIQETERRAIARELHDEIGQVLTAVKINLQSAGRRQHRGGTAPDLMDSVEMVEDAIQRVRNCSLDLRPTLLDDLGLVPTIRWYLERHTGQAGFTAQIVAEPLVPRPPPEVETSCFRVVQEAVTNAMRHARAKNLRIKLAQRDGRLEFSVRDDGVGFDVKAARRRALEGGSIGLLGMEERVELLGGEFAIDSAPGRGTLIQVTLPVPGEGTNLRDDGGGGGEPG